MVSEAYDEVVFTDPTETFYAQLERLAAAPLVEYSQQAHFIKFSDTEDAHALLEAQKFLQSELAIVKERLNLLDPDLVKVDGQLREIQEKRSAKARTAATRPSPVNKKAKK